MYLCIEYSLEINRGGQIWIDNNLIVQYHGPSNSEAAPYK